MDAREFQENFIFEETNHTLMIRYLLFCFLIVNIIWVSCQTQDSAQEEVPLMHLVMLNVKDDINGADLSNLVMQLESLQKIEQVKTLRVGSFKDLQDKRALSDYEVIMEMGFASEAEYRVYQDHPDHIAVRTAITPFLSGPPATYDYWIGE